ncbi:MAG: ice-binding family protein [Bacteroidota bacterium]
MKTNKLLTTLAIVSVVLIAGCKKDEFAPANSNSIPVQTKVLATVPLGGASNFAVLAGTTVTNDGASLFTGDLGVSPGTAITGFQPAPINTIMGPGTVTAGLGIVNGTIYAGGPVAAQAHNDAVIAYNFLVAQVPDTIYSGVSQLDGLTFTPGVYSFAPSANLQVNGTLYLDFQGNSDALFIFQMGTTLVTMTGSKVIALNNNNQPCSGANVYWAVGSSATIDGAQFVGTVIATTTITMTSGANVSGRILALGGAVTMITDTISVCGSSGGGTFPPTLISTDPLNLATGVALNKVISATFSQAMDPLTINTSTFTLKQGTTAVSGTVAYSGTTATFTPSNILAASTEYTATITTGAKDLAGNALAANTVWSFTTAGTTSGLAVVDLGVAGDFVILSKTGITDVFPSAITGDVGSSPITGAAILVSCAEVTGTIYTVDAAGPLPCRVTNANMLTTAVSDMEAAYTDAAGRTNPDFLNLGAGNIGGETLTPGLYKWTSAVIIPTDVTISGGPNDVWIFQVAGTLTMSSAVNITLSGGAQAKNIFWQTAGAVTFETTSHFEGNILGMTDINLQTGASINGRMLAQTAVTLQMNTVTQPQ